MEIIYLEFLMDTVTTVNQFQMHAKKHYQFGFKNYLLKTYRFINL